MSITAETASHVHSGSDIVENLYSVDATGAIIPFLPTDAEPPF